MNPRPEIFARKIYERAVRDGVFGLQPGSPYLESVNFANGKFSVRSDGPVRIVPGIAYPTIYPGYGYPPPHQNGGCNSGCHGGSCSPQNNDPPKKRFVGIDSLTNGKKECPTGTCPKPAPVAKSSSVAKPNPAPVAKPNPAPVAKPAPMSFPKPENIVVFGYSGGDIVPKEIHRILEESRKSRSSQGEFNFDVHYASSAISLVRILNSMKVDIIVAHGTGCNVLLGIGAMNKYAGKLVLIGGATYGVIRDDLCIPQGVKSVLLTHHDARKTPMVNEEEDLPQLCNGVSAIIYVNDVDKLDHPLSLLQEKKTPDGKPIYRLAVIMEFLSESDDDVLVAASLAEGLEHDKTTKIY